MVFQIDMYNEKDFMYWNYSNIVQWPSTIDSHSTIIVDNGQFVYPVGHWTPYSFEHHIISGRWFTNW